MEPILWKEFHRYGNLTVTLFTSRNINFHQFLKFPCKFLRVVFPAACGEFVIPAPISIGVNSSRNPVFSKHSGCPRIAYGAGSSGPA